jgi:hypothetical protein
MHLINPLSFIVPQCTILYYLLVKRKVRVLNPDCKVLFLSGELFVVNGSCAETKAEHLRNFQKFGVSRWSEMAFSEFSL